MKVFASFVAVCGLAAVAQAGDISQVNGLMVKTRVFNDFAGSNLQIDGAPEDTPGVPNTYARAGMSSWTVLEQFPAGTTGNFANKHLAYFSADGGASAFEMSHTQGWTMELDIFINANARGPRKEGVIQIENPRPGLGYTDEGHILVASDGEVAVFGGVMPFTGMGNAYTMGTTAHMSFQFFAPGEADATLGAYRLVFTDAVTGVHDSGIKLWGAAEPDGTTGFNEGTRIALAVQNQRNPTTNDFGDFRYTNITLVPAPGTMGLLGLSGLVALRRRR